MPKIIADVQNRAELIAALHGFDAAVPRRSQGRTTDQRELYVARHLLLALATADCFAFPISVCHRYPPNDRPDVVLHTGTAQIGIEITEAIPKSFAALSASAEKKSAGRGTIIIPLGDFDWEAEPREWLRQGALSSPDWNGSAPEEKWAAFMSGKVIKDKLHKLAGNGFQLFDENWLAIYDNLPVPPIDFQEAIKLLQPLLADIWTAVPRFDALFIEHEPEIAKVTASGSEFFEIGDAL